jgi:hypothetical protein
MTVISRLFPLFVVLSCLPARAVDFDTFFVERTMRVDYFHSGSATEERISLDRAVMDGGWAGSRTRLLDDTNLGKYFFEVIDRDTNIAIYSRGFASIYGEWETTGEARSVWRTFHESLRFPWPRKPVQVSLRKRAADNSFAEIWSTTVDPDSRFVVRADVQVAGQVWTVLESGPPSNKVDLLVLGDGYTASEMGKYRSDVKRLIEALFRHEPFKSRRSDFNVRALDLPAGESGVSRPHAGIFRRSPLSVHYGSFDSERYVLTYDNRRVRDVASTAPYEFLAIIVNERTYGGGGIHNLYATAASDSAFAEYVFVHELGHHLAGLGDEYYSSDVAYESGGVSHSEPWEPNVTALRDPLKLKWRDLVAEGTPLPTPWNKAQFEESSNRYQEQRRKLRASGTPEEEMERLFGEQQRAETALLGAEEYRDKVGAFEGAAYEARGLYRPSVDCIMFSRNPVGFCPVCNRAIQRVIDLYTRP